MDPRITASICLSFYAEFFQKEAIPKDLCPHMTTAFFKRRDSNSAHVPFSNGMGGILLMNQSVKN